MRASAHRLILAGVAILALPVMAAAQKKPVEFGLDAGLQMDVKSPKTTLISIPVQYFRVGFFVSDRLSVEPGVSFNHVKPENSDGVTAFQARLSALYHFTADVNKSRFFVQPVIGLNHVGGGGSSTNQFEAGGGLGLKAPVGSHMAIRLEGLYIHGFEKTGTVAATDIVSALIGISFFTH